MEREIQKGQFRPCLLFLHPSTTQRSVVWGGRCRRGCAPRREGGDVSGDEGKGWPARDGGGDGAPMITGHNGGADWDGEAGGGLAGAWGGHGRRLAAAALGMEQCDGGWEGVASEQRGKVEEEEPWRSSASTINGVGSPATN